MRKILLIIIGTVLTVTTLTAQQNMRDVVYLKNGSIIKGIIIEQIPFVSYKIQTTDGSIFVFSADDVERIAKEQFTSIQTHSPGPKPSSRIGGTFGLAYANEGGKLNPGIAGSIFWHHTFANSFLSVNVGVQHYSYKEDWFDISIQSIPFSVGYNGILHQENNTYVYIGMEVGILYEKGYLAGYGSENASGIIFSPVFGASIPLSKAINFDCFVKPMFSPDGYNLYYSTSLNIGISFNLNTK